MGRGKIENGISISSKLKTNDRLLEDGFEIMRSIRKVSVIVMALVLYQSEDAVFGTGIINDGGETMKISASGRIEDDRLILDATSLGTVILYRMALATNGQSASGDYRAFSNNEPAWMGTVEGTRI